MMDIAEKQHLSILIPEWRRFALLSRLHFHFIAQLAGHSLRD